MHTLYNGLGNGVTGAYRAYTGHGFQQFCQRRGTAALERFRAYGRRLLKGIGMPFLCRYLYIIELARVVTEADGDGLSRCDGNHLRYTFVAHVGNIGLYFLYRMIELAHAAALHIGNGGAYRTLAAHCSPDKGFACLLRYYLKGNFEEGCRGLYMSLGNTGTGACHHRGSKHTQQCKARSG